MIIVIEGPDGAGKSTLAQLISDRCLAHGFSVTRISAGVPVPDRDPFEEYEMSLPSDQGGTAVICDRWSLGELIYGPMLRGHSRLTPGGALHTEMFLNAAGAWKIMLAPPLETLRGRLMNRGDDLINADQLSEIRQRYVVLGDYYRYERYLTNRGISDLDYRLQLLAQRDGFTEMMRESVPGYVGSRPRPDVILAGDVRAGDHPGAFTPASAQGCAHWLMSAMDSYWYSACDRVGLLNTGEPRMDLYRADKILSPQTWIALGEAAAHRLTDAGIAHARVYHPQYVRRFGVMTPEEYITQIRQIAGLQ